MASEFDALGVRIVGVSTDALEAHQAFAAQHDLQFGLVPDGAPLARDLGIAGVYATDPKLGEVAFRHTVVVDADGVVLRTWKVSDAATHPGHVLQWLQTRRS